mgnify:CR=1 FL=1
MHKKNSIAFTEPTYKTVRVLQNANEDKKGTFLYHFIFPLETAQTEFRLKKLPTNF